AANGFVLAREGVVQTEGQVAAGELSKRLGQTVDDGFLLNARLFLGRFQREPAALAFLEEDAEGQVYVEQSRLDQRAHRLDGPLAVAAAEAEALLPVLL